ncbi:hypothetical protein GIB67_035269 [Kingdonia uniflora]|uniref:Ubiquitin-like protease family profile domain-containing protein n=1 Tax=Kingdonia uniflora TaxID=39325 RepID=A0A7J7KXY3_9MAGN|nr:hypothetical protein GIB67_035269 [Kingdonia uniflora]
MKSDKEVNEQVNEENQTQEGRAKKGTSNAKNYSSQCIGLRLYKMFVALPEEKKSALRATCFAPLLLIDSIATMSTLVVKIFYRHLGDMKFQFWERIIQMKPIHVCLILGLCVSSIANEFLFVDPEHMKIFRMRRFLKKKKTYGLKEIDDALKQAKLEIHQEDVLRLNLLKIILSFLLPNNGKNRYQIEAPAIGVTPTISAPAVGAPVIGSSSSATEIGAVVVRKTAKRKREGGNEKEDGKMMKEEPRTKKSKGEWQKNVEEADVPNKKIKVKGPKKEAFTDDQFDLVPLIQLRGLIPKKGLANKVPRKRRVQFPELQNIQSTAKNLLQQVAPGAILEVVNALMVDDDVKVGREVNFNAIPSKYGGDLLETMVVAEVAKTDIVFFNQEEVVGEAYQASADQTTAVSVEEQTLEVEKTEDEASQTKDSKEEVKQNKEKVFEGKDDDDGNSQNKPDPEQPILMESEVDVTLKKRHALTEEENDERTFKMACRMNQLNAHLDELLPGVLLESFIQRPISQDEKNQVDQVWSLRKDELSPEAKKGNKSTYIMIENERIVLADIFACQYIDRDFNVWTRNMSSPEGVKLKKKSIWEQITSMQWDRTFSNCIHRENLKVVNSKLILIPWNINDSHWILCVVSFKARKICIYDSMVDLKIANARKKKKLSPGHQLIEDQISTILLKILIWGDFAHRSRLPTGSEVKNYSLNSKWTTRFGKYPIQPNSNDCGVYMLVFMDNLLRGVKFPDLIDGNECRYTVAYDILRLGVQPEEI